MPLGRQQTSPEWHEEYKMRWITRNYKNDDIRVRTKFLWFPKTINEETRWLERATWEECFVVLPIWLRNVYTLGVYWKPLKWRIK